MYYTTHMLFADILYRKLKDSKGIKINRYSFKYGSVKPDLSTLKLTMPHSFEESLPYVLDEMELIIDWVNEPSQLKTREFARRLGIILHYIADYFCLPHNSAVSNKSLVPHIVYEKRMDRFCKLNKFHYVKRKRYFDDFSHSGCKSIEEYINYKHGQYLNSSQNMLTDIEYALQTSLSVANTVINICLARCASRKAA